ncbi:hypothetical protein BSKO_08093 [Bryopsis sp. KO-2023]|nr:hypothetical protein BSKO_08093 [Bryopsis sp. KO-2023]
MLYTIAKRLVHSGELSLTHLQVIPTARVPILKMSTEECEIDLAIHTKQGIKQAAYIRKHLPTYPAMRPVCLVAKTLLKKLRLSNVVDGGLGGFSLANMTLAHCQAMRTSAEPDTDFGDVLIRFFQRYAELDFSRFAVTARHGGVMAKSILERETKDWIRYAEGWQGRTNGKRLLFVEDPLTGVNVASGTSRYSIIQRNFGLACERLTAERHTGNSLDSLFEVRHRHRTQARCRSSVAVCRVKFAARSGRNQLMSRFSNPLQLSRLI